MNATIQFSMSIYLQQEIMKDKHLKTYHRLFLAKNHTKVIMESFFDHQLWQKR